jgi:hypothetical protein
MFKKIIEKLKRDSSKTTSSKDVNAFKESEENQEDKVK